MDPLRFIPRLEEIEGRLTPASLSPDQVFAAASTAHFFFAGTQAALTNQAFIDVAANRAPTQAVAALITSQSPSLADTLNQYVVELQNEKATHPADAGFFNQQIEHFATLANEAQAAGTLAQAVSNRIDALNAATTGTTTTGTGTTGLGTTGLGTTGIGTTGIGTTGIGTTGLGTTGIGTTGLGGLGTTGTGTTGIGTSGTGTTGVGTTGTGTTTSTTGVGTNGSTGTGIGAIGSTTNTGVGATAGSTDSTSTVTV